MIRGRTVRVLLAAGLVVYIGISALAAPLAWAGNSSSSHFTLSEPVVGGLGNSGESSASYQALTSGGILGLNGSADATMQIKAGHSTTNDPALSFAVLTSSINLGTFSAATPATTTASFQVLDYTSYGYVVQVLGNPPSNGSHGLTRMSTTGPSQAGVEQFGINLVANTSPVSLGANPNQGSFGSGVAASNYNITNNYHYASGDTIASGPKSGGLTTFTISYIVNVKSTTPGGQYSGSQVLICTGTY